MEIRCCVCNKMKMPDGTWVEADVDESVLPSHSYCLDCLVESLRNDGHNDIAQHFIDKHRLGTVG